MGRAAAIDPRPSGLAVGVIAILVAWDDQLLAHRLDPWRGFVAYSRLVLACGQMALQLQVLLSQFRLDGRELRELGDMAAQVLGCAGGAGNE